MLLDRHQSEAVRTFLDPILEPLHQSWSFKTCDEQQRVASWWCLDRAKALKW